MGKRKNRAMADGGSRCRRSASASADMVEWLNDNIEFESGMDGVAWSWSDRECDCDSTEKRHLPSRQIISTPMCHV